MSYFALHFLSFSSLFSQFIICNSQVFEFLSALLPDLGLWILALFAQNSLLFCQLVYVTISLSTETCSCHFYSFGHISTLDLLMPIAVMVFAFSFAISCFMLKE